MKKVVSAIIILTILMGGYIFQKPIAAYASNILYHSPCEVPQTYRVGSIDPKYNMNTDQFVTRIDEASEIWEDAIGKNLFEYDAEGEIEINLVYDQRQFLSSKINELNSKVRAQQQTLDPEIENYKSKSAAFREKASSLNNEIQKWNAQGGAPPDEFDKLRARQSALQNEAIELQNEAERLNQSTSQYNTQVGELKQTVDNFNQELVYKPEEGEYIVDKGTRTINIYFDNSQSELVHTLSHELGHALEINHNQNPTSIMYPETTEALSLSSEDLSGLEKACEEENVITTGTEKFVFIITQLRLKLVEQ